MLKGIHQSIVYEGSYVSILCSSTWQDLGSPKLVSTTSELLDFDRRPSEFLGMLPQFIITLGGNIVLINLLVVSGHLDFNILLWNDYVYAMKAMVSTLFRVMYFHHNGSIITIDKLHMIITIIVRFHLLFPLCVSLVFE
jgi:hypothetical protein